MGASLRSCGPGLSLFCWRTYVDHSVGMFLNYDGPRNKIHFKDNMLSYSCVIIFRTVIFAYLPVFNQKHLGIHNLRERGTMLGPLLHLSM